MKKACYQELDHADFFSLFGKGSLKQPDALYQQSIRQYLPAYAQTFWDKHLSYFNGKGIRDSFYYRGTSGILAYLCIRAMRFQKGLYHYARLLLSARSIQEQMEYYAELERRLFNAVVRVLINNPYTMCLAGVPLDQQALISESYAGGTLEYVQDCFRHIFTRLDVSDNYFYQVYFSL